MMRKLCILLCCIASVAVLAGDNNWAAIKSVRDYRIHYTVFPSSFLQPDIAAQYQLTRGDDIAVINIALTQLQTRQQGGAHETLGLPMTVAGTATSLVGQQQVLAFQSINENGVYYYLAEFRHTHLDHVTFAITLTPASLPDAQPMPDNAEPMKLEFSRTLWIEGR